MLHKYMRLATKTKSAERGISRPPTAAPAVPKVIVERIQWAALRVEERPSATPKRGRSAFAPFRADWDRMIKRVVIEQQRADGTTAHQYLNDRREAVRSPSARLAVFERRGGSLAATIIPANQIMPIAQRGRRPLLELLVIYSADRGIIVSGYQIPG